jgi:hypothetical protein
LGSLLLNLLDVLLDVLLVRHDRHDRHDHGHFGSAASETPRAWMGHSSQEIRPATCLRRFAAETI